MKKSAAEYAERRLCSGHILRKYAEEASPRIASIITMVIVWNSYTVCGILPLKLLLKTQCRNLNRAGYTKSREVV